MATSNELSEYTTKLLFSDPNSSAAQSFQEWNSILNHHLSYVLFRSKILGSKSCEFYLKKGMKNCLYFSIQILVLIVLLLGMDFKQIKSAVRDKLDND